MQTKIVIAATLMGAALAPAMAQTVLASEGENVDINRQTEATEQEISSTKSQLADLKQEEGNLLSQKEEYLNSVDSIQSQLDQENLELGSVNSSLVDKQEDLSLVDGELSTAKEESSSLEKEYEDAKEKEAQAKQELEEVQSRLDALEDQMSKDYQEEYAKYQACLEKVESAKKEVESLETQYSQVSNDFENTKEELEQASNENSSKRELEKSLEENDQKISTLETKIKEYGSVDASSQLAKGFVGYLEEKLNDSTLSEEERKKTQTVLEIIQEHLVENLSEDKKDDLLSKIYYSTEMGKDASGWDSILLCSKESLDYCNQLRIENGLTPYLVDDRAMAGAIVNANGNKFTFNHACNVGWGENAVFYNNPKDMTTIPESIYKMWYTNELPSQQAPEGGIHYQNILGKYTVTGFATNAYSEFARNYNQVFTYSNVGKSVEDYFNGLLSYYNKYSQMDVELSQVKEQLDTLLKEKHELEEALSKIGNTNTDSLKEVYNNLSSQLTSIQSSLDTKKKEVQKLEKELAAFELEKENELLTSTKKEKEKAQEEYENSKSQSDSLKSRLDALKEKMSALDLEKSKLISEIDSLVSQKETLETSISDKKKELDTIHSDQLSVLESKLEALQNKIKEKEQKLKELLEEKARLESIVKEENPKEEHSISSKPVASQKGVSTSVNTNTEVFTIMLAGSAAVLGYLFKKKEQ